MANTLVQFRTDEGMKNKASSICEKLGIDLPTYLRICVTKLIQENGVPFSMKIETNPGIEAMKEASRIAQTRGIADMSLEEINNEIGDARKKRRS